MVGPFDLEARAQLTPFPFGRVEGQVGAALHLGALVLRAGVRHQRIDDHGVVDGVRNV